MSRVELLIGITLENGCMGWRVGIEQISMSRKMSFVTLREGNYVCGKREGYNKPRGVGVISVN